MFWNAKRHRNITECMAHVANCALGPPPPLPPKVKEAFDQLGLQPGTEDVWQCSSRQVCIGGHGNSGYLEVGAGQSGWSIDTVIDHYNESYWSKPDWNPTGMRLEPLTIYSCCTGAGIDGASLTWKLAKLTKRQVRTSTGLLFWSECYLMTAENGTQWQMADPDMDRPPPAIAQPFQPAEQMGGAYLVGMEFGDGHQMTNVKQASLRRRGVGDWKSVDLPRNDARRVAAMILFGTPVERPGVLSGAKTAELTIEFTDKADIAVTVYCDSIAQLGGTNTWLRTSPYLHDTLNKMMK